MIVCSSSMNRMIRTLRGFDLLEHGLEPVLELAAVLGARDQRAEVEREQALVAQSCRARRPARCAARCLRRSRSCPRRARRSAPGCSWCGAPAPASRAGSLRRGRSPDRSCRRARQRGEVARVLLERLVLALRRRGRSRAGCRALAAAPPAAWLAVEPALLEQLGELVLARRAARAARARPTSTRP